MPIKALTAPTVRSARFASLSSSKPARTLCTTVPAPYAEVQVRHHHVAYGWRCASRSSMNRRRSEVDASQRARSVAPADPDDTSAASAAMPMCLATMLACTAGREQESGRCA